MPPADWSSRRSIGSRTRLGLAGHGHNDLLAPCPPTARLAGTAADRPATTGLDGVGAAPSPCNGLMTWISAASATD